MTREFDLEDFVMHLDIEEDKKDAHHSLFQLPDWDKDDDYINNLTGEKL